MVDKVPGDITPGGASMTSKVHATQLPLNLSRAHEEGDISRLQNAVHEYSNIVTYQLDDLVKLDGVVYYNIVAITFPENFAPSKWVRFGMVNADQTWSGDNKFGKDINMQGHGVVNFDYLQSDIGHSEADTIDDIPNPVAVAVDRTQNKIFVVEDASPTGVVHIFNQSTRAKIGTVEVGQNPTSIAIDEGNTKAFVANSNGDTVSVINTSTDSFVTDIFDNIGTGVRNVAVLTGPEKLYVTCFTSNEVSIYNTSTNAFIATVTGPAVMGNDPLGIFADTDNNMVYVTNFTNGEISIIDGISNVGVLHLVGSLAEPIGIVRAESSNTIYVCNSTLGEVVAFNATTLAHIKNIPVGSNPENITYNDNNGYLYVTNPSANHVSVIDSATNEKIESITVGDNPGGIGIDITLPDDEIYVCNEDSNSLSILVPGVASPTEGKIRLGNNENITWRGTDANDYNITLNQANEFEVDTDINVNRYAVKNFDNIEAATNQVTLDTIPTGQLPKGMIINETARRGYVCNETDNTVTVFNVDTGAVEATVDTSGDGASGPIDVATSESSGHWFVMFSSGHVKVYTSINLHEGATYGTASFDNNFILFSENVDKLYLTTTDGNGLEIVDTSTIASLSQLADLSIDGGPADMAVDPADDTVYVCLNDDSVITKINGSTNVVFGPTIPVGDTPMGITIDTVLNRLYVANYIGNTISVISLSTLSVTSTIPLAAASNPMHIIANSTTGRVLVTNGTANTFNIIDGNTLRVIQTTPFGNPTHVGVDTVTESFYIVDETGEFVTQLHSTDPASEGAVRLGNNQRILWRTADNNDNAGIKLNENNQLELINTTLLPTPVSKASGQMRTSTAFNVTPITQEVYKNIGSALWTTPAGAVNVMVDWSMTTAGVFTYNGTVSKLFECHYYVCESAEDEPTAMTLMVNGFSDPDSVAESVFMGGSPFDPIGVEISKVFVRNFNPGDTVAIGITNLQANASIDVVDSGLTLREW